MINGTMKKFAVAGALVAGAYVAMKMRSTANGFLKLGELFVDNSEMPGNIQFIRETRKNDKRPCVLGGKKKPDVTLAKMAPHYEGIFS